METLVHVQDAIKYERVKTFKYLRCWVSNYSAPYEFPTKFYYNGCNFVKSNGMFCATRVDGPGSCDHNVDEVKFTQRMYRFELHLTDRSASPPLRVTVFDQVKSFVGITAEQLSMKTPIHQLAWMKDLTERGTAVEVYLRVAPDHRGGFNAVLQTLMVPDHINQDLLDDLIAGHSASPAPGRRMDTFHTPRREMDVTSGSSSSRSTGRKSRAGRTKDLELNEAKTKLMEDLSNIIDLSRDSD